MKTHGLVNSMSPVTIWKKWLCDFKFRKKPLLHDFKIFQQNGSHGLTKMISSKNVVPEYVQIIIIISQFRHASEREKLYQSYGNCHKQIRTSDRNFWSIRNTLRVPMTCRKHSPFSVRDFIQNFYLNLSCACKARP